MTKADQIATTPAANRDAGHLETIYAAHHGLIEVGSALKGATRMLMEHAPTTIEEASVFVMLQRVLEALCDDVSAIAEKLDRIPIGAVPRG